MTSSPTEHYYKTIQSYQRVFLTGSSGYLGSYLLAELLDNTKATVHTLVRGRGEAASKMRLEIAMKGWGLWKPEYKDRIQVWSGDLEKPYFGLTFDQFNSLKQSIDFIIHCAAKVSWTSTLESLEAVNVGSCRYVLELAQGAQPIPISYISTIATLADDNATMADGLDEEDPPSPSVKNMGGYIESKWVAEKLMIEAREQGFPIRIFRPGLICGPPSHPVIHREYFFFGILKAMVESGKSFRFYNYWEITPVDYAAKSILYLGIMPSPPMQTFHIMSSSGRTTIEIAEMLAQYGYPLETVELPQWEQLMKEECDRRPDHAFANMKSLFDKASNGRSFIANYMNLPLWFSYKTRRVLKRAGLTCEVLDHNTFRPYFEHLIQSKEIQIPAPTVVAKPVPLPELPPNQLDRFCTSLSPSPLPLAAATAGLNPHVFNIKDAFQSSEIWKNSPHLRVILDFSSAPSPVHNASAFAASILEWKKILFNFGKALEDRPGQTIGVHAAFGVDSQGLPNGIASMACGFFKSLALEMPQTKLKFVMSDSSYEQIKTEIEQELAANSKDFPAVYLGKTRYAWKPQITTEFESKAPQKIHNGDVIVFTGAGRGIGAYLTEHLGQLLPDSKFAIIGRSEPGKYWDITVALLENYGAVTQENYLKHLMSKTSGKIDIRAAVEEFQRIDAERDLQANLDRMTRLGISYRYFVCDLTDAQSTKATMDEIYRTYSRVDVVIHGAGIEKSKVLKHKTWNDFETILNPKVVGFANLISNIKMNEIKSWINFGSMSSWLGLSGQTDYCAANDFLNAVTAAFNSNYPKARFATINWHGWAETGIVSRQKDVQASLNSMKIHLVNSQSGLLFFLNEVFAGKKDQSQIYLCAKQDTALILGAKELTA